MRARVWCSLLLFAAPVPQAVTLNGKAFPQVAPYVVHLLPARRTIAGDGSDLQTALRALKRGDQLRVKAGTYVGDLKIDANCQSGPITIVFDVKSSVTGNVTIARPDWHLSNLFVTRGAIAIEASSVTIDRLRIAGSVTIGHVRDVTISNSRIARAGVGLDISDGARHIVIANNHVYENPTAGIRLNGARDVKIVGNMLRDNGAAILAAKANDVEITDNTIENSAAETRGIALDEVTHAVVRSNHTTGVGVAVAIGRVDTFRNVALSANDVMIDHNYFDTGAVAASIEAGNGIHFVNNVVDGYASDTVVLGKSPKNVVIANNLFLGASTTAFVVRDPAVLRLFDFNVFSPADEAIKVEVGSETITLQNFLARQTMTHTTQIRGVHFLDRDLGRIAGVDTVDRGTRVGIAFKGAAPDLGVAER